ncbi:hypothetical protein CL630_01920 [bacterium]|nr:hypothetical protein [bacterium]|tara:strand:+ start:191 stop:997 length:807 start_codon:yes stop_codon:yes gene_type:complete
MRYTFKQIFATRYDPTRSRARRLAERFVPINIITKTLSPYSAFVFLNLGISADVVTFLSLGAIFAGAILFIVGYPIAGIVAIFIFGVLDSTDGDVARVSGRTKYGGTLDSLGADFFYALIPSSVGYFLFLQGVTLGVLSSQDIFTVAVFGSLSFLLYRIINIKRLKFLISYNKQDTTVASDIFDSQKNRTANFIFRIVKLYRHVLVKDNFFSEPGLILWFSLFIFFEQWKFLAWYFVILLLYNFGFLVLNFIKMYLTFLAIEKEQPLK